MKKNCKVSASGNVGFTLVEGGPTVLVAVGAPEGTRLTVDTSKVKVTGEPFSKTYPDKANPGTFITTVYVEGEAADGAISYRKLATISGTPPVVVAAAADEGV